MWHYLLGLAVVAVLAPAAVRGADAPKETPKLEGTWVATLWKRGAGEVGKDKVGKAFATVAFR